MLCRKALALHVDIIQHEVTANASNLDVVRCETADDVGDRLWEIGDQIGEVIIGAAFANQDDVIEVIELIRRDWPGIRLTWA